MDINDLRVLETVLAFVVFVGIVAWVWSGRSQRRFDEAALAPFDGEERERIRNEREQARRGRKKQ
ncbi:cbb3-type cytochrome oxidase subunit 3 [Pelomicrobium sp.]|mgnify:CR=1 FL=1|jgi:cytochrome c oxidase cbb3-type subunit 4|uniref:cbb3-type cytochrome oxidase subunit 3 n=1 Tax=Pelomicrobium sp. TaxID=2815319 RepID=UPI002FDCE9CC